MIFEILATDFSVVTLFIFGLRIVILCQCIFVDVGKSILFNFERICKFCKRLWSVIALHFQVHDFLDLLYFFVISKRRLDRIQTRSIKVTSSQCCQLHLLLTLNILQFCRMIFKISLIVMSDLKSIIIQERKLKNGIS